MKPETIIKAAYRPLLKGKRDRSRLGDRLPRKLKKKLIREKQAILETPDLSAANKAMLAEIDQLLEVCYS